MEKCGKMWERCGEVWADANPFVLTCASIRISNQLSSVEVRMRTMIALPKLLKLTCSFMPCRKDRPE